MVTDSEIVLAHLYQIFSRAVFLAIPRGQKKPVGNSWQALSFEQTQASPYQAKILDAIRRGGNAGVLLGPPSDNLHSIDIDGDELVEPFLKHNPELASFTRTRGQKGCQIFFRPEPGTNYPNGQAFYPLKTLTGQKWGEWRCGESKGAQSIVYGLHPAGMRYQFVIDKPAIEWDFGRITWPPELVLPWKSAGQEESPLLTAFEKRIEAYLDKVDVAVQGKGGSDITFRVACLLVNGWELKRQDAIRWMRYYSLNRCRPPWSDEEIGHKVDDALKAAHPRPPGYLRAPRASATPLPKSVPDVLVAEYGSPVFLNKSKQPAQLNERFWAALYAHENIILYEPDEHQFFVYSPSNGLYEPQSVDALRGRLQTRIREHSAGLARLATEANLRGVIAFLRGQVEQRHAFRPAANFIHLANGVLVFKDGKFTLEKFSPKFMSRNQSPVSYDRDAAAPRFLNEFLTPLHPDDVKLIQKYFGQVLLGRNITQTILLLDGESDTGKTTLAKIMRNMIGVENSYQLRTSLLNDRFEVGRYIGKTFLLAGDVDAKFLSTEGASRLKALVGGDPLPAELKKNNAQLTVEGVFNVVITSNCRLLVRLQGDTEAWRRRLLVVRYQNSRGGATVADFDKVLIEEEGSGILNFALAGAATLFNELASNSGRMKLTPEQKARLNKLLDESDSLRVFLKNSLIQHLQRDLTVNEILEEYFKECIDDELQPIPLDDARKMLDSLMMELFAVSRSNSVKRSHRNQRGFSNVCFR